MVRAGKSTFSCYYALRPVCWLQVVLALELARHKARNQGWLPGTNKRSGARLEMLFGAFWQNLVLRKVNDEGCCTI